MQLLARGGLYCPALQTTCMVEVEPDGQAYPASVTVGRTVGTTYNDDRENIQSVHAKHRHQTCSAIAAARGRRQRRCRAKCASVARGTGRGSLLAELSSWTRQNTGSRGAASAGVPSATVTTARWSREARRRTERPCKARPTARSRRQAWTRTEQSRRTITAAPRPGEGVRASRAPHCSAVYRARWTGIASCQCEDEHIEMK